MKKNYYGVLLFAVLLAAGSLMSPLSVVAQGAEKEKPAAKAEAKSQRPYPFHGKLGAMDKEKKTLTIIGKEKSRTLYLQAKTKIEKNGKPATFEDAAIGEEIAGRVTKSSDGKEMLVSLRIGPKPAAKPKKEKPAKGKKEE